MRTVWLLTVLAACGTKSDTVPAAGSGSTIAPVSPRSGSGSAVGPTAVEPTWFERADNFADGLAPVLTNGKWGYVDKAGRFAIAPVYSYALPFTEGHAWVYDDRDVAFIIDRAGNRSAPLPEVMHGEKPFMDGYAVVFWRLKNGNTRAIIDTNGKPLIDPSRVRRVSRVFGAVLWEGSIDDHECVFDRSGTCIADEAFDTHDGRVRVTLKDKQGVVDRDGKVMIPIEHSELRFAEDGHFWTRRKDRRWQALDDRGKLLDLPPVEGLPIVGERIKTREDLSTLPPDLRGMLTARYAVVHEATDGMIRVEHADKTAFYSLDGKPLAVR